MRFISFLKGKKGCTLSLKDIAKLDVTSAYQSEYAQNFLQNNGFREMFPLKDYINIEHCKEFTTKDREDIILYNPKKGLAFTRNLIKLMPEVKWVPIINMRREQVIEAMRKAKVYIDFGYHPGKDRLPRECAMNGLCIITGKKGSARFYEDVWIDNKYKFDNKENEIDNIVSCLKETIENYEEAINDFRLYRYMISLEKSEFEYQIQHFFLNQLYDK